MKFLLTAFLLVIVSQSVFSESAESRLRTRCTFFADRLILNCTGPSGRVECQAADQFPLRVKIVGISIPESQMSREMRRFNLHPLREDNIAWMNSRVNLNGTQTVFSLYQSRFIKDAGFRLRDAECFDRLFNMLNASAPNLVVPSTDEPVRPIKSDASKAKIRMVGEIFWFERSFPSGPIRTVKVKKAVSMTQGQQITPKQAPTGAPMGVAPMGVAPMGGVPMSGAPKMAAPMAGSMSKITRV